MIVKDLNIKEFRGIKSCKHPLEFSNFNVLIGRNNSGKSSILEALFLIQGPESREFISEKTKLEFLVILHSQESLSDVIKRPYTLKKPDPYSSLIHDYVGKSTIEYNNIDQQVFSIDLTERTFDCNFDRDEIRRNESLKEKITSKPQYIQDFIEVAITRSSNSVLFIPYDTNYMNEIEKKMEKLKKLIIKKGIHVKVAMNLNKCVDDEYSEILFEKPMRMRKVIANNFTYINMNDLGSGAEKLVKIMTLIEIMEPKLILIDDFEAGFHPSMINIFLKWLSDLKSQVVLSTHSIDILYKLTDLKLEDCKVLFLKKSHEDILEYNTFSLTEIEDLLNANNDPRLLNL